MAILADLERLLERIFERSLARLFRTRIQAVQLERRVERTMEHARVTRGGRTSVPSRYRVRLAPPDVAAVAEQSGGAEALAAHLADAALGFARTHGYHLHGRPTVALLADPSIVPGEIAVDAVLDRDSAAERGQDAGALAAPVDHAADPPLAGPSQGVGPEPLSVAEPVRPPVVDPALTGVRGDGTQTLVFRRPAPPAPCASLRVIARDGSERTVEMDGMPLTIGRARENGLVLADPRVSRHHGRMQARHGALVYADLGSTNGSRVNGVRVDEIVLGAGDRIQVGDSIMVVETLPH